HGAAAIPEGHDHQVAQIVVVVDDQQRPRWWQRSRGHQDGSTVSPSNSQTRVEGSALLSPCDAGATQVLALATRVERAGAAARAWTPQRAGPHRLRWPSCLFFDEARRSL